MLNERAKLACLAIWCIVVVMARRTLASKVHLVVLPLALLVGLLDGRRVKRGSPQASADVVTAPDTHAQADKAIEQGSRHRRGSADGTSVSAFPLTRADSLC